MTTTKLNPEEPKIPSFGDRWHGARPLRVLVVDDDRDTVKMLIAVLQDDGHVVHGRFNGKEVLPAARIFCPDAIIIDVNIPGLSGYAVAQAIRHAFVDLRRPLLISISGMWTERPDRLVGEQMGFDHQLTKPAEPKELTRLLEGLRRRPSA